MSDFDEPSRRNWEYRRQRRSDPEAPDDENVATRHLILDADADEDVEQAERRSPINPRWRRERTSRTKVRRSTGAFYSSPQEFQLWLQRGGWLWLALSATAVVAVLVFTLIQTREARGDRNPFIVDSENTTTEGGMSADDGTASEPENAGGDPLVPQQPTLTPQPPASEGDAAGGAFVVTNTGTQGLFLRAEPSPDATIVDTLPDGTRVEQIGEDSIGANYVWRHVRSPGGQEGWVAVDWLQPAQ